MTDKKKMDEARNVFKTLGLRSPGEFYTMPIHDGEEATRDFLNNCCSVRMKLVQPAT